ncbi:helix-turn-helix domain-containing protein [Dyella sp. 20L07]|uniref:helix-turn-helix domain-containing protein n=1 Tax=Dyella sp. 20L07 TaxID=3384240 RepID=UPI003D2C702A
MHPAQIKAALTIAGYKQTDVARECGVAPTTIGAVINGRSRSKQVEEWIAHVTGKTLEDLWPQWYGGGQVVLSDDEIQLVLAYRALSPIARMRLLTDVSSGQIPSAGHTASSGGIVSTGADSRIAAGDYYEHKPPTKKR